MNKNLAIKLSILPLFIAMTFTITDVAKADETVVRSNTGVKSRYIPYDQYPRSESNWPLRSEGCVGRPADPPTQYKSFPWMGAYRNDTDPRVQSGNYINTSGNCVDRFHDGGTNTTPGYTGVAGPWIGTDFISNWVTNNAAFPNSAINAAGCDNESAKLGDALQIWGVCGIDTDDKSQVMIVNNGFSWDDNDWYLYSNGTTLFYTEFNLTQAQIDALYRDNSYNPRLDIIADDWFVAYINGVYVAGATSTVEPVQKPISKNAIDGRQIFKVGKNQLALQVSDKAVWAYRNESIRYDGRGSGVSFALRLIGNIVSSEPRFTTFTEVSDHEKGSGDKTVTHTLRITSPCPSANRSVDWTTTGMRDNGKAYNDTRTTVFGPGQCNDRVIEESVDGPWLDLHNPGYKVTYTTQSDDSDSTNNIIVFEAPFARFFGNDVAICGTGDDNRFVFDTSNHSRGSFAEYASIYLSGNNTSIPNNNDFSGLNSSRINSGFPAALDTNWNSTSMCDNGLQSSDFAGVAGVISHNGPYTIGGAHSGQVTYNIDGDVTITSNITTSAVLPFNPDTYPVVLIYATGDINIDKSVTSIEAVLVSEKNINTCTNGSTQISQDELDNQCRNQLNIIGSVTAKEVHLQRAIGTRLLADTAAPNGLAAEVIEYPWYLNFVRLNLKDQKEEMKFDAYFSLPPRL